MGSTQKVPVSDYRWLREDEIRTINWANTDDYGQKGYILMVDLSVPESLHEKFSSFPLATESLNIFYENLSPYSQDVIRLFDGETKAKRYISTKLTGTFLDKKSMFVTTEM